MKKIIILAIPILVISGFLFYWYQIRPIQIKHDCSWVKQHSDAVPGRPAMTKEELVEKGIIRSCQKEIETLKKVDPHANYALGDMSIHATTTISVDGIIRPLFNDHLWEATSCIEDGNQVIAAYKKSIAAVPAKAWYEPASKDKYNFCIHDKGL